VTSLLTTMAAATGLLPRARTRRLVSPCCRATSHLMGGLMRCCFCGVGYALRELVRKEPRR
jgi:hypothetical protein